MSVVVNRVPIGLRGKRTDLALRSCTSLSCAFEDFLAISKEIASGASGSDSELCGIFIWVITEARARVISYWKRRCGGGCELSLSGGTRHWPNQGSGKVIGKEGSSYKTNSTNNIVAPQAQAQASPPLSFQSLVGACTFVVSSSSYILSKIGLYAEYTSRLPHQGIQSVGARIQEPQTQKRRRTV